MTFTCPISLQQYPTVLMAHGGGGRLMHQLIERMFLSVFGSPSRESHDAAVLSIPRDRIAFTTDSYVVSPLFFPGGDIGSLAVNGTVNDLAMAGARPLYLSLGLIIEEGLPMETLWRVVRSIKVAADLAQVEIVTGDTKVVDRGKLAILRSNGAAANAIGKVVASTTPIVILNSKLGTTRILDLLSGEQLPRIF
jgi:hydrogenase expression/formation protein HypE